MARLAVLLAVCGVLSSVGAFRKTSKLQTAKDTPGGSAPPLAGTYEVWTGGVYENYNAVIDSNNVINLYNQFSFFDLVFENVQATCDQAGEESDTMYFIVDSGLPGPAVGHTCLRQVGVNLAGNSYGYDSGAIWTVEFRKIEVACPGGGLSAHNLCWYLSSQGADCRTTCAAKGATYQLYIADAASPIVPLLLGREPTRLTPWARTECYNPPFSVFYDEYYTAQQNPPRGVGDNDDPGTFKHHQCQLACPCAP